MPKRGRHGDHGHERAHVDARRGYLASAKLHVMATKTSGDIVDLEVPVKVVVP